VFINGNSKGSIDSIPIGGHIAPNSTVGERALVYKTICYFFYVFFSIWNKKKEKRKKG